MINIIAAVGKNLELGKDNKLLFDIPNDLKYFKEITLGKTIVMGRKTFESIKKPLPGRENIVITNQSINSKNIKVVHDYKEILNMRKEVFIIGGESIYRLFLPYAKNLYLTEIEKEADADTYFPNFDKDLYDKKVINEESYKDLNYSYVRYRKK